jgi:hypothetical protein
MVDVFSTGADLRGHRGSSWMGRAAAVEASCPRVEGEPPQGSIEAIEAHKCRSEGFLRNFEIFCENRPDPATGRV